MVTDGAKVGRMSDVTFFTESDVLVIDAVNVIDVNGFCCNSDVLGSALKGWDPTIEAVVFRKSTVEVNEDSLAVWFI